MPVSRSRPKQPHFKEFWKCRYCGARWKDMVKMSCAKCGDVHAICKPCRRKHSVARGRFPKYAVKVKTCPTLRRMA